MPAIARSEQHVHNTDRSRVAHWRQVRKCSTIESAEVTLKELREQGLDGVLSMIDGLCVLVRREMDHDQKLPVSTSI